MIMRQFASSLWSGKCIFTLEETRRVEVAKMCLELINDEVSGYHERWGQGATKHFRKARSDGRKRRRIITNLDALKYGRDAFREIAGIGRWGRCPARSLREVYRRLGQKWTVQTGRAYKHLDAALVGEFYPTLALNLATNLTSIGGGKGHGVTCDSESIEAEADVNDTSYSISGSDRGVVVTFPELASTTVAEEVTELQLDRFLKGHKFMSKRAAYAIRDHFIEACDDGKFISCREGAAWISDPARPSDIRTTTTNLEFGECCL